jgi:APA family basic amino acid/polyamine antiporter
MTSPNESRPHLVRGITFWGALSIVMGSMIGTGVFLKSAGMAQLLGSPTTVMLAWLAAGVLSLAGAFTYAEIGSRFPRAGGEYVYLKEAYGELPAFLFGWTRVFIVTPCSIAAYGVGAATFMNSVISTDFVGGSVGVAIGLIIIFSTINCFAVSLGGRVQTLLTFVKAIMILFLVVSVFVAAPFANPFANQTADITASQSSIFAEWAGWSAFGSAMVAALWAFDGWNNLPMASGEIQNPKRSIPFALVVGTVSVMLIYLLVNLAYFYALPFDEVLSSNSTKFPDALPVASKATSVVFGVVGVTILSIMFVVSALGSMNGSILTGARVPYAMAHDGLFPKIFATLNIRSNVPVAAVVIQGLMACLLAMSGSFDQLTDWVVFASWLFYGAVTFSVFIFRRRDDVPEASYQVYGYPYLPLVFCILSLALLGNSVYSSPRETMLGLLFVMLGIPVYWILLKKTPLSTR